MAPLVDRIELSDSLHDVLDEAELGRLVYDKIMRTHPEYARKYHGVDIWIHPCSGNYVIGDGVPGLDALGKVIGRSKRTEVYSRMIGCDEIIPPSALMD